MRYNTVKGLAQCLIHTRHLISVNYYCHHYFFDLDYCSHLQLISLLLLVIILHTGRGINMEHLLNAKHIIFRATLYININNICQYMNIGLIPKLVPFPQLQITR